MLVQFYRRFLVLTCALALSAVDDQVLMQEKVPTPTTTASRKHFRGGFERALLTLVEGRDSPNTPYIYIYQRYWRLPRFFQNMNASCSPSCIKNNTLSSIIKKKLLHVHGLPAHQSHMTAQQTAEKKKKKRLRAPVSSMMMRRRKSEPHLKPHSYKIQRH